MTKNRLSVLMHLSRTCITILGLSLGICAIASAQSVPQPKRNTLWLDYRTNLSNPDLSNSIVSSSANRVIIPVLWAGEARLQDVTDLPFRKSPKSVALVKGIVKRAHQKGAQVYGLVDVLHWKHPDTPDDQDLFLKYPALAERNLVGSCGAPADGKYASPFNQDVVTITARLMERIAKEYPDLDGVVLLCRLPLGAILGYSDAARIGYIKKAQVDPVDLKLVGSAEEMTLTGEWVNWRLDQMAAFVQQTATAYKSATPSKKAKVAVIAYANLYRLKSGSRNTLLEDWAKWLSQGSADEVLFESKWELPNNRTSLSSARALAEKVKKNVAISVIASGPAGIAPNSSATKLANGKAAVPQITLPEAVTESVGVVVPVKNVQEIQQAGLVFRQSSKAVVKPVKASKGKK